ncbi:hypothetical protein ERJ75_001591700 [Trypanosoma vivax]|nr:hypothetical protein ERJ75_001591700 [Trypanosoma vivax]
MSDQPTNAMEVPQEELLNQDTCIAANEEVVVAEGGTEVEGAAVGNSGEGEEAETAAAEAADEEAADEVNENGVSVSLPADLEDPAAVVTHKRVLEGTAWELLLSESRETVEKTIHREAVDATGLAESSVRVVELHVGEEGLVVGLVLPQEEAVDGPDGMQELLDQHPFQETLTLERQYRIRMDDTCQVQGDSVGTGRLGRKTSSRGLKKANSAAAAAAMNVNIEAHKSAKASTSRRRTRSGRSGRQARSISRPPADGAHQTMRPTTAGSLRATSKSRRSRGTPKTDERPKPGFSRGTSAPSQSNIARPAKAPSPANLGEMFSLTRPTRTPRQAEGAASASRKAERKRRSTSPGRRGASSLTGNRSHTVTPGKRDATNGTNATKKRRGQRSLTRAGRKGDSRPVPPQHVVVLEAPLRLRQSVEEQDEGRKSSEAPLDASKPNLEHGAAGSEAQVDVARTEVLDVVEAKEAVLSEEEKQLVEEREAVGGEAGEAVCEKAEVGETRESQASGEAAEELPVQEDEKKEEPRASEAAADESPAPEDGKEEPRASGEAPEELVPSGEDAVASASGEDVRLVAQAA